MIVPAAGHGSRLGSTTPKVLFPVNGRPMIDYVLDLYRTAVDAFVVVLQPSAEAAGREHCRTRPERIAYAFQDQPTGMLDAVVAARSSVNPYRPRGVWITWCDQIAVHPKTVDAMAAESAAHPAALIFPAVMRRRSYIHFERDRTRQIIGVLHQREDRTPRAPKATSASSVSRPRRTTICCGHSRARPYPFAGSPGSETSSPSSRG
jgi:bifunctional UDP-N-acetylglucosamine pyrophosphorylase/glucosamine-1-phosphate N-acetyltransferase